MMKFIKSSPYGVHILAVLFFIILSYAYFFPVIEGKKLVSNDNSVYKASAKEIIQFREKYHEEPLWTNSMFGGMPAYQISVKYKGNVMRSIVNIIQGFKFPVATLFLSLVGFYILLLVYGVNPWISIPGAIAFAFPSYGFILLAAGHITKAYAIAYVAPMVAGIIMATRKNRLAGTAITALFLAFELIANHLQITYYALLLVLIYGCSELVYAIKENKVPDLLKSAGILIIALILAVGSNFTQLKTTKDYLKYTTRGGSNLTSEGNKKGLDVSYATDWSIGINETLTLLIPNYMGGGSSFTFDKQSNTYKILQKYKATEISPYFREYWGEQPSTSSVYAGAIVVFLFVLGLFLVEGRDKWWLLAATIFSILLSWGRNFMPLTNLFLEYFPGYNKFRAVSTILVISGFTIPLLGALTLKNIFQGTIDKKKFIKSLLWSSGITGGICLIFAFMPGLAGGFMGKADLSLFKQLNLSTEIQASFKNAMIADRKELLQADAFRSFIFIALAATLLLFHYNKKLQTKYAVGLLAFLLLLDMWPVSKRYLNSDNFENVTAKAEPYQMTNADKIILADNSPDYRVLNLTVGDPFSDASTSNYHKSVGGYHGAKLQIYQEFIEYCIANNINDFYSTYNKNQKSASLLTELKVSLSRANALNILNTKYLIIDPNSQPLINDNALGNAWFVESIKTAENADKEIAMVNTITPSNEAVIEKKFADKLSGKGSYHVDSANNIVLTSYKPNELIYKYTAQEQGFVVFSEIYYPDGWKAFIDGKESSYVKADYVLRAMEVPEGTHEIIFRFDPDSYNTGIKVSLASSVLLILLCIGSLIPLIRKKKISE